MNAFQELVPIVENLALAHAKSYHNIIPNVDNKGLNETIFLDIIDCHEMECLVDTTQEVSTFILSNLENLYQEGIVDLTALCNG